MSRAELRYPFEETPGEGEAVEVAEGVFWLRLPLPLALDHVNIYALRDPDGWTIIDTGMSSRRGRAIWEKLLAGPLAGLPVKRVLVTHHHPDHVGLAGWFQSEQGAELWMPRTGWLFARMLSLDVQESYTPETLAFYRGAGMDAETYRQRKGERPYNYADIVWPMPLGFRRIKEGDTLHMGGRDWVVRTGGGHAPEQATLWSKEGDLVLGADQLLPSISPNLGVYGTEPEADPVSDWLESCTRFQDFATEDQLVLPGHKLPFTGLPTRLDQLIANHHGALERLRQALQKPLTAAECFLPIFKRQIRGGEYGLALVEAVAHLNHLHQLGEVRRTQREDGAWIWQMNGKAAQ